MSNDRTGSQRLVKKWLVGAGNLMRNDGTGSQRLACWFENSLEGQVIF